MGRKEPSLRQLLHTRSMTSGYRLQNSLDITGGIPSGPVIGQFFCLDYISWRVCGAPLHKFQHTIVRDRPAGYTEVAACGLEIVADLPVLYVHCQHWKDPTARFLNLGHQPAGPLLLGKLTYGCSFCRSTQTKPSPASVSKTLTSLETQMKHSPF
ncbi:hypothetical protein ABEB36_015864 [Hypothenemus hampei]|uniref:Uncharacterized protein n=1 Tax=Hypothenemus hampei TaxID=57062 RepID=A0ABD1DZC0_HYPHA